MTTVDACCKNLHYLNKEVDAFVYVMNRGFEVGYPAFTYQMTVEQGYRDFGFSLRYLEEAVEKGRD